MNKAEKEEFIFGKLFDINSVKYSKSESPDFIVNRNDGSRFGVEIVERYFDKVSGMLKNSNIVDKLLSGGNYKTQTHPDFLGATGVRITNNKDFEIDTFAVVRPIKDTHNIIDNLIAILDEKNSKYMDHYNSEVEFIDLIIFDRESEFINLEDVKSVFKPDLMEKIGTVRFKNIYFIFSIDKVEYYINLKLNYIFLQYYILSELINDLFPKISNFEAHKHWLTFLTWN